MSIFSLFVFERDFPRDFCFRFIAGDEEEVDAELNTKEISCLPVSPMFGIYDTNTLNEDEVNALQNVWDKNEVKEKTFQETVNRIHGILLQKEEKLIQALNDIEPEVRKTVDAFSSLEDQFSNLEKKINEHTSVLAGKAQDLNKIETQNKAIETKIANQKRLVQLMDSILETVSLDKEDLDILATPQFDKAPNVQRAQ